MSPQAIMAGSALALTGVTLIAAIHQQNPPGDPFSSNLTNSTGLPELQFTIRFSPPGFLFTNSKPPLALELTNQYSPRFMPEAEVSPGVYVAQPYVIAVLVPGKVDPKIVRGSQSKSETDDMVRHPQLRLDPVQ